jgi:hypothetical protein
VKTFRRLFSTENVSCYLFALKNHLPHIVALLFFAFLLLPLASLLFLQGLQWYLGTTAAERMEHHSTVTISLPEKSVIWHKKGKELVIDGKLFDVDVYSVNNGELKATGIFDEKETDIVHLLSRLTKAGTSNALLKLMLALQCFPFPAFVFLFCVEKSRLAHPSYFSCFLPLPHCLMIERPPRY